MESGDIMTKVKETQDKYYDSHAKHRVFKNNQKLDCAKFVSNAIDLEKMIQCTAFIIPNTNIIYYNYQIFKTFGNEDTHIPLYNHVTSLISKILETYEKFEFHINMKTFTISACQRYHKLITNSFDENTLLTDNMEKLVVYHTPHVIDQITRLLYSSVKPLLHKVEYVREESESRINNLFNILQT